MPDRQVFWLSPPRPKPEPQDGPSVIPLFQHSSLYNLTDQSLPMPDDPRQSEVLKFFPSVKINNSNPTPAVTADTCRLPQHPLPIVADNHRKPLRKTAPVGIYRRLSVASGTENELSGSDHRPCRGQLQLIAPTCAKLNYKICAANRNSGSQHPAAQFEIFNFQWPICNQLPPRSTLLPHLAPRACRPAPASLHLPGPNLTNLDL
jgi:hypothetical protein